MVGEGSDDAATGLLAAFGPGSRLAGYRLEEQVGAGGMAVVFRAVDQRLRRPVALKILAPGLASDHAFRQRFIRESRAAAAVDDPYIIPVYEAGEADGVLFIAMRLVPGQDVRTLLHRDGPLAAGRAAAIVSQVASALDAAHAAGLVHRDVKPANMLIDVRPGRPDHVYLADFGIAKGATSAVGLTGTRQPPGTPDYMAPEQIEGRAVDGRADQYALACAAFELLAGEPPFRRDQVIAIIWAHLFEPPPSLGSRCPGLPEAVDTVVATALAKAPQDRFSSCQEFAKALSAALGLVPFDAGPGPRARVPTSPAGSEPPVEAVRPPVSAPRQSPMSSREPPATSRPAEARAVRETRRRGAGTTRKLRENLPGAPAPEPPPSPPGPSAAGGSRQPEAAGAGLVPRQLPAGAAFFAGREAELRVLDELLDQAGGAEGLEGPGGAVVISAVAGMAGVGKTALAVHWARKVAGRFPDGQLYVNLRGYDTKGAVVTAEEVTGWFLVALGIPAGQIPADAQARCGLYRSVLAGRRVLIMLDNARDAAQVRPLLPGGGGCLVVVTSRSSLAGLAAAEGARPLRLGPLDAEEAVRLLAARLGPERVAAEPEAVADLIARCGHLPLALAVTGARAAADPGLPLGVLAGQLAGAAGDEAAAGHGAAGAGRLEVLETGDPATSLRQLLSWSHRQLTPEAAQMFALLGVHCGPDITVPAAASLAGVPRAEARRALAELADASLAAEHRPGRYVIHDLVRGYAAGQARQALGEAGMQAAVERSLDHYLHTRVTSYNIPGWVFTVAPPVPGVLPEQLADEAGLQDWARAEHQVVLQAIAQAATAGLITRAWQLFHDQAWWVGGEGYWADIQAAARAVLAAAEAAGDDVALGWTHAIIGRSATYSGAHDEVWAHLALALDHFQRAGDLSGQAWAHLFTSAANNMKRDWAEGVTQAGQALTLFRQTADQAGQGWALVFLGECHARLENYDLARGYARQALEVTPAAVDPTTMAMAWDALGFVHSRLGEPRQAITCYRQALALLRGRKQPLARLIQITMLPELGEACRAAGDLPAAVEAWQQAQANRRDLGWPESQGIRARLEQAGQPTPPG